MKKVITILSVVGLLTACGSSTEGEAPKTDSTTVAVDTVAVVDTIVVVKDSVPATTSTVAAAVPTKTK
jgi:hypothetical protein